MSQLGEWDGVMDVRGLALAQGRMGSILLHEKQGRAALQRYRDGLGSWVRLAAKNPRNLGDQMSLAQAHTSLGRALVETGEAAEGW